MKTKTLLFSLAGAVALMLTSCSMSVHKRHYNNGYYVSFADRHHNTTAVATSEQTQTVNPVVSENTVNLVSISSSGESFATPVSGEVTNVPAEGKKVVFSAHKNVAASEKSSAPAEQKMARRELKKAVKQNRQSEKPMSESLILEILLAILIPPLGVWLHEGGINTKFWIDLILCLLFFLPGMIYALIVVLS